MKKTTLARLACLLLLVTLLISLFSCGLRPNEENRVTIKVKGFGRIVIELNPEAAPITVENFKKLVKEDFYNGLTFHRIADLTYNGGYIVQGGDPQGDGSGGSDTEIKGEFKNNGVDNPLKHIRGTVSMARSTEKDSASSQFFICTNTLTHLDDNYAAFGMVVKGMDVVDKIAAVSKDSNNMPTTPVVMKWVRMGSFPAPAPFIVLAVVLSIVILFVYVVFQSAVAKARMEDALTFALRGDKRKRKALEKSASGLQSAFYLHAKGILPKNLIVLHGLFHALWLLLGISVWAICLYLSWLTLILTAVSLAGIVAVTVALQKYPMPAKK